MSQRDPQGPARAAYDNGTREWHLKPGIMITILVGLVGLGVTALTGGIWLGVLSERVSTQARLIERMQDPVSSVKVVQNDVATIKNTLVRIRSDINWMMQQERRRSNRSTVP